MKRVIKLLLIVLIVVLIGGYVSGYRSMRNTEAKSEEIDSFDFSLRYNVNGDDKISTFDNICIVHTVEGIKEFQLELSKRHKTEILSKMKELNILDEDYSFIGKEYIYVTPCANYELVIKFNSEERIIKWTTNNIPPFSIEFDDEGDARMVAEAGYRGEFEKVKSLLDIKTFIVNILGEYEEFKSLPEHIRYQ